jgi:outer membrane protein OmpA-like peptidoglycan-associated protein
MMNRFVRFALSLLTAFAATAFSTFICHAQDDALRIGLFGHYSWNQHTANFRGFPGVYEQQPDDASLPFQRGTGNGVSLGALLELPLADRVRLSLRVGYDNHQATLQRSEVVPLPSGSGGRVDGRREYIMNTMLAAGVAEPLLLWSPLRRTPGFSLIGGIRAGLLLDGTFNQRERIAEPSGRLLLEDETFQRQQIPSLQNFQAAVVAGFSYELPLELTTALPGGSPAALLITPEALISYSLTPFAQNVSWTGHSLRAGLSIKFVPALETNLRSSASAGTAGTEQLTAKISALALDDDGRESPLLRLRVEEFQSKQVYPLLPYVFFDASSAALPARYARLYPAETSSFSEASVAKGDQLDVYYHVLNIIGRRMRDNPSATLKIVGCLGDALSTPGSEGNDPALARRRAETVQKYLQEIWGIGAERLKVEGRTLPRRPTNTRDVVLNGEENRRVELSSDDWSILKPVALSDTLRDVSPSAVKLLVDVVSQAGVAKWSVKALQGRKILKTFSGAGAPDNTLLWTLARTKQSIPTLERAVQYNLELVDNEEREAVATGSMPIEIITPQKRRQKGADKRVDIVRIINFEPERADATTEHIRILDEFVRPLLTKESSVLLTGMTDLTGDIGENKRLSELRAQTIAKQLLSGSPLTTDIIGRGIGSRIQLYPNTTPEGRFYGRMVEIRIETPIQ